MHHVPTHLLLSGAEHAERAGHAAQANRAARVQRLRLLDRRVEQATARARLVRLALG